MARHRARLPLKRRLIRLAGGALRWLERRARAAPHSTTLGAHATRYRPAPAPDPGRCAGPARAQLAAFTAQTGLFGHLPELNSMAVAGLLTEIEDQLDILIEDEDVDGDLLGDYGSLLAYVTARVK